MYDNFNYIKGGWVNRNRLLVVNSKPIFIRVPVKKSSSMSKLCNINIDNKTKWRNKLLKIIYYNYRKTIFFEEIFTVIEGLILKEIEYLTDLNCSAITQISHYLDISTDIVSDISNYELLEKELSIRGSYVDTFFNVIQKPDGIKSTRVIYICKNEQADTFVNAIGGQELYNKQIFLINGIKLCFINTLPYSYKQRASQFFPNLSIIDVLMNCGKEGTKK